MNYYFHNLIYSLNYIPPNLSTFKLYVANMKLGINYESYQYLIKFLEKLPDSIVHLDLDLAGNSLGSDKRNMYELA